MNTTLQKAAFVLPDGASLCGTPVCHKGFNNRLFSVIWCNDKVTVYEIDAVQQPQARSSKLFNYRELFSKATENFSGYHGADLTTLLPTKTGLLSIYNFQTHLIFFTINLNTNST